MKSPFFLALCVAVFASCTRPTAVVTVTSAAGQHCDTVAPLCFDASASEDAIVVDLGSPRQTVDGIGVSLTESSAFVLACIDSAQREQVLQELFSAEGADFAVTRTHIGSCDFCVEGCYALCETPGDTEMTTFTLDPDKEGFDPARYPYIKGQYDLYHLMKDALRIREDGVYRVIACPWTAPAWMKDNGRYYERANGVHRGGALLPQYYQAYANYISRFIEEWKNEGLNIWAVTPVNEPMGNDGGWESMDFWPEAEANFIGRYLGPTFEQCGLAETQIMGFDQNIFEIGPYTAAIYGDSAANLYTPAMALHWYGSTYSCFPEVLDSLHALYPDKRLMHIEGCIDNLGCPAWTGVTDPKGFTESGWFMNENFWWTKSATDWAYSTPWDNGNHPAYSPVHRYAQFIIDGMNHWLTGFVDWNVVLDSIGGPNHVNNFAAAPVMVDYANANVWFTPYYYVLKQFSRSMRPGDTVLTVRTPEGCPLHVCAVRRANGHVSVNILNKEEVAIAFPLTVGRYTATVFAPANSVMTLDVTL